MNLRNERGFTLMEVVMASFILVIGLGIIGSITSRILRKNFYSQRHTQAVILAQNRIEQLLNDGYESVNLTAGEYENPLNPVDESGDSAGVFTQSWAIQDVYPISRAKYITSNVDWQDREGETHSVVLTAVCIDQSD